MNVEGDVGEPGGSPTEDRRSLKKKGARGGNMVSPHGSEPEASDVHTGTDPRPGTNGGLWKNGTPLR